MTESDIYIGNKEKWKKKKSIVIFQVHPLIIFAVAQWLKIFFEGAIQKWYFCKAIQTEISTIETEFHISCDNYLPLCWLELIFNSNVPIEFRDLTCHLGCSQILHNFWSVLPVGSFLQLSVGNFQWNYGRLWYWSIFWQLHSAAWYKSPKLKYLSIEIST